ncbi:hypothetical protein KAH27_09965 [bacterium]|nr:hypothetical protein [bacterium]
MKKIIIGIAVVLVVGGTFAYRYYYVPNQLKKKFTSKLVVNKKSQPTKQINKSEKNATEKNISDVTVKPGYVSKNNLLKNGKFDKSIDGWHLWREAEKNPQNVKIIDVKDNNDFSSAVRIENPNKKLLGVSQVVQLTSGIVYRVSGAVRSLGNDSSKIFGGRIAIYLPPQKENAIVWMSEYDKWWEKDLIFTNEVTGPATVYVHLGYGGIASTGEFSNIGLEAVK